MAEFFDNNENIREWEKKISANGKNNYYIFLARDRGRVGAFCCAKKI
jgi:hypothetical protein